MALEKLSLVCPPALEDDIVDGLLEEAGGLGFTSLAAFGHGTRGAMTISEQVRGKQRRTLFEIVGEGDELDALVATLRRRLPNAEIHYWIVPVRETGRL